MLLVPPALGLPTQPRTRPTRRETLNNQTVSSHFYCCNSSGDPTLMLATPTGFSHGICKCRHRAKTTGDGTSCNTTSWKNPVPGLPLRLRP